MTNLKYYIDVTNEEYDVNLVVSRYMENDNLALQLITTDGLPFVRLTVNLGELPDGYAYIDTNNAPYAEQFIKTYNIGKPLKAYKQSGFCSYPLYKIDINRCEMLGGKKSGAQ